MTTTETIASLCECSQWCRANIRAHYNILRRDGVPLITNHHERCPHYNDSLIDVWKVTDGTMSFYCETEVEAMITATVEAHDSEGPPLIVTREQMHREIFENLPEFEGF